jgi:SAM-dependent methyltransferase
MLNKDQVVADNDWFSSDLLFDKLYPENLRVLASRHWTPIAIAKQAMALLAPKQGDRILDIGSGVGKFCLTVAQFYPLVQIDGIEQRSELVAAAQQAKATLAIKNAAFFLGDFTEMDFTKYTHLYFFNSFYENLIAQDSNDANNIESADLFNKHNRKLYKLLKSLPVGIRLATYHSTENEMPADYHIVAVGTDEELKCWVKV